MNAPLASVVIPTRNRREILRENLLAAGRQTVPVEIVVVDDGSTDGTPEMMRSEFPHVRYERFAGAPHGPSFIRNHLSRLASAPILFPIDDDAVMVSPHTVEQTLAEFDGPRIGAVGIPFVNIRVGPQILQCAPDDAQPWVQHTFTGAAHAVRRDVFLAVGGYREHLFYMGEEGDLTLRMLARGWVTRLGRADPIEHHESPHRVTARADFFGRRNDVLFALHNVPATDLLVHLGGTLINGIRAAIGSQYPFRQCAGLAVGLWQGGRHWTSGGRQPVTRTIYKLHRSLKKSGAKPLTQIERALPPLP